MDNWDADQRQGERQIRRNHNLTSEKLCFLLRHRPAKDKMWAAKGRTGGWFSFEDILSSCRRTNERELTTLVESSRSFLSPHPLRFELMTDADGKKWARAKYGHSFDITEMEKEVEEPRLPKLTSILLNRIASNIAFHLPDLAKITDGTTISMLFDCVKSNMDGKVSNKILKAFMTSATEFLDFKGILVEESIIRLIPKLCPNVFALSFENCFSSMTDTNLQFLMKRLTNLTMLDISGCNYLTEKSIDHLIQYGTNISVLKTRWLKCIKPNTLEALLAGLPALELINVTSCSHLHPTHLEPLRDRFDHIVIQFDTVESEGETWNGGTLTGHADDIDEHGGFLFEDREEDDSDNGEAEAE